MMDPWEVVFYFGLLGFLEAYAVYRYLNNQLLGSALRNGIGALVASAVYRIAATEGAEGVLAFFLLIGIIFIMPYALIHIAVPNGEGEDEDEDDTTPRALLTTAGFDPDDLNKENNRGYTPMAYYSYMGNVTMVRYLIARGADCRQTDSYGRFPLFWAAFKGHLEIVKLLSRDGGAHEDIRRVVTKYGYSPLRIALKYDQVDVWKWLILNGALVSRDRDGGIDDEIMRRVKWDLDAWRTVLSWAQNVVTAHDNSELFVSGTIIFPDDILEIMSDYVAGTQQEVRTLRQLIERLPAFLPEVPFVASCLKILYHYGRFLLAFTIKSRN